MNTQELLYLIALQKVPNIGDTTIKKLIDRLGSAKAVFTEKKTNLQKIEGIGTLRTKYIGDDAILKEAENEIKFIEEKQVSVTDYKSPHYPELLKHCIDGPVLLYSSGNIDIKNKKIISVVGTRQITSHGIQFCEELIEELAVLDPVIVSGFAYGTDITAQKAALDNKLQTIGCLAHGLDQIYPKAHKKFVADIEKNGGFLTDFCSGDTFDRNNFLKRNRIIAGMSEATIVIESAEKGGSLVTADIANSYNREVFAVPGRPKDKFSKGCNNLIKKHQARTLTTAADIIYYLDWDLDQQPKKQTSLFVELDPIEKKIVDALTEIGKAQIDELSLKCEIPTHKLATNLLNLELKGVVRPLPGKQFEII
ncbi:MAG: DNA-processing protein DprA [Bacteroidota bacterium]